MGWKSANRLQIHERVPNLQIALNGPQMGPKSTNGPWIQAANPLCSLHPLLLPFVTFIPLLLPFAPLLPSPPSFTFARLCSLHSSLLSSRLHSRHFSRVHSRLYSRLYSGHFSRLYSGHFSRLYSRHFSRLYSRHFSRLYSRLYSRHFSRLYSRLCSRLCLRLYSRLWSRHFPKLYSRHFLGLYGFGAHLQICSWFVDLGPICGFGAHLWIQGPFVDSRPIRGFAAHSWFRGAGFTADEGAKGSERATCRWNFHCLIFHLLGTDNDFVESTTGEGVNCLLPKYIAYFRAKSIN